MPGLSRRDWIRLAGAGAYGKTTVTGLTSIPPKDEVSRDPALAALLRTVRGFSAHHDFRGLEKLMLPTFRVDFDFGKGPQTFQRRWHPESPSSALWATLDRLLSLGGTFYSDTLFAVPYVYTQFPAELDPLGYVVATRPDTQLLEAPKPDARTVASVDYAVIPLARRLQPPVTMTSRPYLEAKVEGAGQCFVAQSSVYSPAAYRAFFEKRKGRWYWISLVCATLAEPPDLHKKPRH